MNTPLRRPWRSWGRLFAGLVVLLALPLAAGQASLNVYFQSTLKDPGYQKKVFQKVAAAWKAPATSPKVGKKCVVQAVISRDGRVQNAFVSMESGVKAWDKASLVAVESSSPFPPLPESYPHKTLEAHFHVAVVP
ncbi:MAG: TonB C-terminal domain-containing protein [Thermoanaerobaculia bacterium]|nr:TonB C-terminal domain-containing protein [Thermoanaerobaculia bacterium]